MEGPSQRRRNLLKLNTHFIWATKDRLPLIGAEQERSLYRFIETVFQRYNGTVLAIGGMADPIHTLVSLSPKLSVSEVIKNVKGCSSRFFSQTLKPGVWFAWQPNYAAIHVSPSEVERIKRYILHQKEHHTQGAIWPEYEAIDEEEPPCRRYCPKDRQPKALQRRTSGPSPFHQARE